MSPLCVMNLRKSPSPRAARRCSAPKWRNPLRIALQATSQARGARAALASSPKHAAYVAQGKRPGERVRLATSSVKAMRVALCASGIRRRDVDALARKYFGVSAAAPCRSIASSTASLGNASSRGCPQWRDQALGSRTRPFDAAGLRWMVPLCRGSRSRRWHRVAQACSSGQGLVISRSIPTRMPLPPPAALLRGDLGHRRRARRSGGAELRPDCYLDLAQVQSSSRVPKEPPPALAKPALTATASGFTAVAPALNSRSTIAPVRRRLLVLRRPDLMAP